jgi:hypothetical protein
MSRSRALETDQLASIATDETRLLSRRTVVRTGVTAAWSVPLIQVVGAAPALAVSGSKVEVIGGSAVWDGNYIIITVPLKNSGTQVIDNISVTLTFSNTLSPEPNSVPGKWSTSASTSGGKVTITYATTRAGLQPNSTLQLVIQVKETEKNDRGVAGSVSVAVVSPAGAVGTGYNVAAVVKR